jgi:hypothetical protein
MTLSLDQILSISKDEIKATITEPQIGIGYSRSGRYVLDVGVLA